MPRQRPHALELLARAQRNVFYLSGASAADKAAALAPLIEAQRLLTALFDHLEKEAAKHLTFRRTANGRDWEAWATARADLAETFALASIETIPPSQEKTA